MGGVRLLNMPTGLAVRFARFGLQPNVLVWQPEPPDKGQASAARRLAGGIWLLEGRLVDAGAQSPWDVDPPDHTWRDALHGQGWLDDVAAAKDPQVWKTLSGRVWEWLDRYGRGGTDGWAPNLVARRLVRWIAYSPQILQGRGREQSEAFFHILGAQCRYLGWRWRETPERIERIEALTGLVYAQLSMQGVGHATERAIADLGRHASRIVREDGSIASRNPEELARILALLIWCSDILEAAGLKPSTGHLVAIRRAAPLVRALTDRAGMLPRFHGGRNGSDLPLARLGKVAERSEPAPGTAPMGFARMAAGASLLIMDGAQAPSGLHATTGHSSALAFEMRDGAHPMIVNCGTGSSFGPSHAIAARRAEAHSTIQLGNRGAGQLTEPPDPAMPAVLSARGLVRVRVDREVSGIWAMGESKHYEMRLGLHVERRLHLSPDGKQLSGEDTAIALSANSRMRIAHLFPEKAKPCPMKLRFHVHPDVTVAPALSGRGIALTLRDGAIWIMKSDAERFEIQPSQYFDEARPQPRATSQIVATSRILEYWGRVSWSLEKLS